MPIQLNPISRRTFLRRALLTGAGLALAPQLHAAMRRTDATSFALLADTHIAAEATKVHRSVNMSEHFKTVAREIIGLPERAARVFIVGDCAFNAGETTDYAQLSSLLDPLRADGLTLNLALGNHDHRENFWAALESQKAARRPIAQKQVAFIKTKHLNWLMLDSLDTTMQTPGALGVDQLQWVAKILDVNKAMPAVILVHHNPGEDNKIGGLKDTEALLEIIRPRKQVKAWIYGHTHNWKMTEDASGVHLVNLPPVAYIFREGDPAGWIHARTRPDGMKLELRAIDPSHKAHGQVVDLKWRAA
ncbi:MAG: metallophosphoesterase [Verrucomicrobiota bacterium]